MKIAVIGAGAIGGLVGARLAMAGEDVTFLVRGANLDAIRNNGMQAARGGRPAAGGAQRRGNRSLRPGRPAGHRDPRDEGPSGRSRRERCAQVVRPRDRGGDDAERHPLLVLPPAWRQARRQHRAQRRPQRGCHRQHPARARDRLRGVPGLRTRGARRRQAHRRRPLPGGRTRRLLQRAREARRGLPDAGRLQGAGAGQHPRRDLAEAVGQPDLQSHQQPVAFHAGRHLPVRAIARSRRRDDAARRRPSRTSWASNSA